MAVWNVAGEGSSGTTRREEVARGKVTWRKARFEFLSGKEKRFEEGAKERDKVTNGGAPFPLCAD